MRNIRVLSGREVCKILAAHDFVEVRQRGSHITMQLKIEATTITLPVPNHTEVKMTWQSIIRQSGLPRHLFEET